MDSETPCPSMHQSIFYMDLPVETISLYLLCCSLCDSGTPISTKNLMEVWNSTPEAFVKGLEDLENLNVIRKVVSDRQDKAVYRLTDIEDWKR